MNELSRCYAEPGGLALNRRRIRSRGRPVIRISQCKHIGDKIVHFTRPEGKLHFSGIIVGIPEPKSKSLRCQARLVGHSRECGSVRVRRRAVAFDGMASAARGLRERMTWRSCRHHAPFTRGELLTGCQSQCEVEQVPSLQRLLPKCLQNATREAGRVARRPPIEGQPLDLAPRTFGCQTMQEGHGWPEHTQGISLSPPSTAPLSYGHGNGSCAVSQKSQLSELELLQMQGRRNTRVLAGLLLIALLSCVLINQ